MLEKGMGVLELLADYHSGLTIQEMCSHLSYPKTTIYRLANTLLEMGYLGKDEDTNHFFLSRKLFRLGLAALGGKGYRTDAAVERRGERIGYDRYIGWKRGHFVGPGIGVS